MLPESEKEPTPLTIICVPSHNRATSLYEIVEKESSTPLPLSDTQRWPTRQREAALRATVQVDGFFPIAITNKWTHSLSFIDYYEHISLYRKLFRKQAITNSIRKCKLKCFFKARARGEQVI